MRARGLKLEFRVVLDTALSSRPMRARGLKHVDALHVAEDLGRAPCGRVG